jgi:hypothetical protein
VRGWCATGLPHPLSLRAPVRVRGNPEVNNAGWIFSGLLHPHPRHRERSEATQKKQRGLDVFLDCHGALCASQGRVERLVRDWIATARFAPRKDGWRDECVNRMSAHLCFE